MTLKEETGAKPKGGDKGKGGDKAKADDKAKKQTRLGLEAKKEDILSDWYSQVLSTFSKKIEASNHMNTIIVWWFFKEKRRVLKVPAILTTSLFSRSSSSLR
jgi:hypothetical protein